MSIDYTNGDIISENANNKLPLINMYSTYFDNEYWITDYENKKIIRFLIKEDGNIEQVDQADTFDIMVYTSLFI